MGAILGTVPGWQKAPGWAPGNRVYTGPGYIKYEVPPKRLEPGERYEYIVTIDITVYFCDSPDLLNPLVIRSIEGIKMISIYAEEYSGGLSQWISDVSIREAEELHSRSNTEMSGLVPCDKKYDIRTYDEDEIVPIIYVPPPPKVPADVLASIARLEIRKKRVSPEIAAVIQFEIDELKKKYRIK